jgi:hypothetical protein
MDLYTIIIKLIIIQDLIRFEVFTIIKFLPIIIKYKIFYNI